MNSADWLTESPCKIDLHSGGFPFIASFTILFGFGRYRLISDPSLHKGADVAGKSDTDVERAVAALGAPSMAYRTFRPEPPTPRAATQSQSAAVAFPLLAAALPEVRQYPDARPASFSRSSEPDRGQRAAFAERRDLVVASLQVAAARTSISKPDKLETCLAQHRCQTDGARTGVAPHAARRHVPHVACRTDPAGRAARAKA